MTLQMTIMNKLTNEEKEKRALIFKIIPNPCLEPKKKGLSKTETKHNKTCILIINSA